MQIKSMINWAIRRNQTKAFIARTADVRSRLARFNEVWEDAYTNVPFYDEWKKKHGLPGKVSSLKELLEWPVLEKRVIMANPKGFVREGIQHFSESVTGGSTGEPLHFRVMPGDEMPGNVNMWLGRARLGLFPDSRTYLLWGNRHGHGQGLSGKLHACKRQIGDWMTNRLRVDATNLSRENLLADVNRLIAFRPACIIAYSASLLSLVRVCADFADCCGRLGVRGIVCTAGPLTKFEREEISRFFNAPVIMEYGSMEGGVIAYQSPADNCRYKVFDATHIVHVLKEPETGKSQALVTKLYKSYFPLIRYRIGDYILDEEVDRDGGVTTFSEVLGRTGDEVDMGNGIRFHGQSFMLCAEGVDKIVAYQLRVNRVKQTVAFIVQVKSPLTDDEKSELVRRSSRMSGLAPESISVEVSNDLAKTPSGKIRLVFEEK